MPLITVLLTIVVVGLLLWLALRYIPMARPFPQILTAVVVACVVLWLLSVFGLIAPLQGIRVR